MLSLDFRPPYDSPIEEILAWNLAKWLKEGCKLEKQVEVKTPFAKFYLDLVAVNRHGKRIGFECDGKEYHTNKLRDECRDAIILQTGIVSAIYRFCGKDLFYHEHDCIYFVAKHDPSFFNDRLLLNLPQIGSETIQNVMGDLPELADEDIDQGYEEYRKTIPHGWKSGDTYWIPYVNREKRESFTSIMTRRTLVVLHPHFPEPDDSAYLKEFLEFAKGFDGIPFDELVERYSRQKQDSGMAKGRSSV